MRKCYEFIITGRKVCGVGYRPFLLMNALNIGLENIFAYNRESKMVVVRVSGEEDVTDRYIDLVRSSFPAHAEVSNIEVREFEGPVMETIQFLQILQFEQISKGIPAILNIDKKQGQMLEKQDSMLEKQDSMLEKQDSMLEKQDSMLEKQDTTIEILRGIKEDTTFIKEETTIIKEETSTIKDDTSALREDLSLVQKDSSLGEKYEQLSREIVEIKATLAEIKTKVS